MNIIKAGLLVSYDYNYLRTSLPLIYRYLESITLCLDVDRRTWSGRTYEIKDDFWGWLKALDVDNKIEIYQDVFYLNDLSPMDCDTRQRKMLAERMGQCDWYIQIDSDEYFLDFPAFLSKLKTFECSAPSTINLKVAPIFKKTENGYLLIETQQETLPFATNNPQYTHARFTAGNKIVFWDDLVLHQSWARDEEEIAQKLNNWGHTSDFNTSSYYKLWKAIDGANFIYVRDFHPLQNKMWSSLKLIPENEISGLIEARDMLNELYRSQPMIDSDEDMVEDLNQEIKQEKKVKTFRFWRKS